MNISALTPHQIVAELDKYIIGQKEAKKSVAIALRNRWRRLNAAPEIRDEIMPNNIIMIGPTGVGKTEIARRLAKLANAPFIKVEATKFTEVGYVGRDVDSMIRELADLAVNMVKEEQKIAVRTKAAILAEERILDHLVPSSNPSKNKSLLGGFGFGNTNGDEAEQPSAEEERQERTRQKFRERLQKGELDDREIEMEVNAAQTSMMQVFTPMGMEEMGMNLQEILGNMSPKRKKRRLSIREARQLLIEEEAQKLIDMEAVTKEALKRVHESGIVFIDEIDKVAAKGGRGGGPDVSREGVQRDLLPIVEGSNVTTKHGLVRTDHILFIASGAFHVAKPSDLIPELQGRFPIRVELQSLSEEDFYLILTQPQNALLKQYQAMMETEGVTVQFTDDAVREIARIAAQVNEEVENIGARRLHTILTSLMEDLLFDVPDAITETQIEIDGERVLHRLGNIVQNRDLSRYIL